MNGQKDSEEEAKVERNLNFEALKKNLIDVTIESQIKLGYTKTTIGFYYPMESLNSLLDSSLDVEGMSQALQEFKNTVKKELGNISISRDHTRFCIQIPKEGVEYVHGKCSDTGFLEAFIKKIGHCNVSLDDILEVFYQYSKHVICKKIDMEDFDYTIYFEDGTPDDFRYCIKFEGCHAIYHRFTPKDYDSIYRMK